MGFIWTLFTIFVVVLITKRVRETTRSYQRRRKRIHIEPDPVEHVSATRQLLEQLGSNDPAAIKAALHGLVTLGDEAAPELRQALHDADPVIRSGAAAALRRIHREDVIEMPATDPVALEDPLLIDPPPRVRTEDTVVEVDAPPSVGAPPSIEEPPPLPPVAEETPAPVSAPSPSTFDPTRLASSPPTPPRESRPDRGPSPAIEDLAGALLAFRTLSRLDPERAAVQETLSTTESAFRIRVAETRSTTDFDASEPFRGGTTLLGTLDPGDQAVAVRLPKPETEASPPVGSVVVIRGHLARWDDIYDRAVFEGELA